MGPAVMRRVPETGDVGTGVRVHRGDPRPWEVSGVGQGEGEVLKPSDPWGCLPLASSLSLHPEIKRVF